MLVKLRFFSSFTGGLIGFLWFNTYPADVFMGDTGSLTVGALISAMRLWLEKNFTSNYLWNFLLEVLSVIIQVSYFKYTKKKRRGERIFLMSQFTTIFKKRIHESKIEQILIVGVLLSVLAILTLKVR